MTGTADVLRDDGMCFGCGPDNPIGLKLTFWWEGDVYQTRWTPDRRHQGWAGRLHGGFLALLLDETLSRAALERHGIHWVTAELTTRLTRPAPVGEPLLARAWLQRTGSRLIVCAGEVVGERDGRTVATGQAKMMRAAAPEGA